MCQLSNEGMQGSPAETLYKNNKEKSGKTKERAERVLGEYPC